MENQKPTTYFDSEDVRIIHGDCLTPNIITKDSVDLVVTSPPYLVGIEYENYDDATQYSEYLKFTEHWIYNCYSWLKNGSRICINVPFETAKFGKQTVAYDVMNIAKRIGFKPYCTIIWNKGSVPRVSWGCYDDKTKVLTLLGFKYFKDVDINTDLFATLNLENGKIEYQKAFDYIEKLYHGEMYKIHTKAVDLLITPNHNMVIRCGSKNNKLAIKQIKNLQYFIIPQGHCGYESGAESDTFILPSIKYNKYDLQPVSINMDDWLMFLGIFLTDGYCEYDPKSGRSSIRIYQSKSKFMKEIMDLLSRLPFDFHNRPAKCEFYTCNRQLASYLSQFGKKNMRSVPNFIDNLSIRQKRIFVNWLMKGDGNHYKDGKWRGFCSTSILMMNKFINYVTQLGYGVHLVKREPNNKVHIINGKKIAQKIPIYLAWLRRGRTKWVKKHHISTEIYNGMVYCVSVPNKTLLIERNGKTTWCGNSWMSAKAPLVIPPVEAVLLMYKGEWKKTDIESKESDIYKDEFVKWCDALWTICPEDRTKLGHPAPFPIELPRRCIKLLTFVGDVVLDPFMGSGSTLIAAHRHSRESIGIEISEEYCKLAKNRIESEIKLKQSMIF